MCAHNSIQTFLFFLPLCTQVPPGGGGGESSSWRNELELRRTEKDEAVSGPCGGKRHNTGECVFTTCQSSSDKGSYWDESSTEEEEETGTAADEEEEEEVGTTDEAVASDEGPPPPPLPTGLLGATAMDRTESAENGYAYVVGNGCGGGGWGAAE